MGQPKNSSHLLLLSTTILDLSPPPKLTKVGFVQFLPARIKERTPKRPKFSKSAHLGKMHREWRFSEFGSYPFDHPTQDMDSTFPFVVAKAAAKTDVKNAKSSREEDKTLLLHCIDGKEEELDRRIHQKMSKSAMEGFIQEGNLLMTEKLLCEFPEMLNETLDQTYGATATWIAAREGHLECLKLLVTSRADVDKSKTDDCTTPTFIAAEQNHLECLRVLVASRADLDQSTTIDESTPTIVAVQRGHLDVVRLLIASRADLRKFPDEDGKCGSPLYLAKSMGHKEIANELGAALAEDDSDEGVAEDDSDEGVAEDDSDERLAEDD